MTERRNFIPKNFVQSNLKQTILQTSCGAGVVGFPICYARILPKKEISPRD